MKTYYKVLTEVYDNGRAYIRLDGIGRAITKPADICIEGEKKDVYEDWFDTEKAARAFIVDCKEGE